MAKRRGDGDGSITWDASVQLWVGRLPRDERGRRAKVSAKTKAEARAKQMLPEQLLVVLKDIWYALPAVRAIDDAGSRTLADHVGLHHRRRDHLLDLQQHPSHRA